jgi:hypothetical protein
MAGNLVWVRSSNCHGRHRGTPAIPTQVFPPQLLTWTVILPHVQQGGRSTTSDACTYSNQEHCIIEKLSRCYPGCPRYRRQGRAMRTVVAEETRGKTWYLNPIFLIWLFYAWISWKIACFCVFSEAPTPYLSIGSTRHATCSPMRNIYLDVCNMQKVI